MSCKLREFIESGLPVARVYLELWLHDLLSDPSRVVWVYSPGRSRLPQYQPPL